MASSLRRLLPLADRVLVQRFKLAETTQGGIYLPEKSSKKMNNATVVAVGPGTINELGDVVPPSVKPGDSVLLPEFGGTKVDVENDEEMYLFRESELLGKWEQ